MVYRIPIARFSLTVLSKLKSWIDEDFATQAENLNIKGVGYRIELEKDRCTGIWGASFVFKRRVLAERFLRILYTEEI